jgi:hypothetical protein
MFPTLIVHVGAGIVGIVSGFLAVSVRKGARLHRMFGTVFFLSTLIYSSLAVYLALFVPPIAAGGAPPSATVPVGILTFYLATTGWMTVSRTKKGIGPFDYGALFVAFCVATTMFVFGLQSAGIPTERLHGFPARYYTFASFAAFGAILDLKVILRGGISGAARIARHLWRMCFALFFASAFFFLGQQRVMPRYMHGSPTLFVPALAPLVLLIFWMIRVRLTNWYKKDTIHSD